MTIGHTSKGTKSYCHTYCISCVIQIAADQVGACWRIFVGPSWRIFVGASWCIFVAAGWRMHYHGELACYRQAKSQNHATCRPIQ